MDHLLIDATERAYHRSADDAKQRAPYSGKKTAYAEEYYYVAPEQVDRLSGADVERAQSRLPHVKHEFPPELDWLTGLHVRVDLGYLGIQSDYGGDQIAIPMKKPRKSTKHPNPQLSDAQKAANKVLRQVRICIEHAIGGMKRSNILIHTFRNRIKNFEDDVIGICAGLWTLVLSY